MRTYRITYVLVTLALALFMVACQQGNNQLSTSHASPTHTPAKTAVTLSTPTTVVPVKLLIPVIGVSAAIEAVGSLPNGDMGTPTQNAWANTGWYSAGPQPGEQGSAVIDGHLDRPGGAPAVFWSLRNLQNGDSVMVLMTSGKTLHFRVTRLAFYSPTDAPLQEIFGDRSGVYLNLITCAGDWIPSQHQTTQRLVVYTSLVEE